jgi:hypothetical protein
MAKKKRLTKREREKQNALTKIAFKILLHQIEISTLMVEYRLIQATPVKKIKGGIEVSVNRGSPKDRFKLESYIKKEERKWKK